MTVVLHVTVVVLLVETGVGDDGGSGSAGNGGNGNGNGDVCKHIFGEGVTITYYQQEPLSRQPTTTRGGWVEVKSIAVRDRTAGRNKAGSTTRGKILFRFIKEYNKGKHNFGRLKHHALRTIV